MATEWRTDEKLLVAGLSLIAVLCFGTLGAVTYNSMSAEPVSESEPYDYHYTYCSRTTYGVKGQSSCAEYKPAVEKRVDILMRGVWWEYITYRVVSDHEKSCNTPTKP